MSGYVCDIQQFSVNDGYGIRTMVFLSGCSLKCAWCQNPETISPQPLLMFDASKCAGCGLCIEGCPGRCTSRTQDGMIALDRATCNACFECVSRCVYDARRASCRKTSAQEIFSVVKRDEVFFKNTGGGLTLSGGEPLLQSGFCAEILSLTKDAGIHTAIETAGNLPFSSFEEVLPFTDLLLYDIKLQNEEAHIKWTGVSNARILENFSKLCQSDTEIIVRVPLIPDVNDGQEFCAIVDYVCKCGGSKEIHILPYHTVGSYKYQQLGIDYTLEGLRDENDDEVKRCASYAQSKGLKVSVGGAGF